MFLHRKNAKTPSETSEEEGAEENDLNKDIRRRRVGRDYDEDIGTARMKRSTVGCWEKKDKKRK